MRPIKHRVANGSFGLNTFNPMHMLDLAKKSIKSASVKSHAHTCTHAHASPENASDRRPTHDRALCPSTYVTHTELGTRPTNPEDVQVGGKEARIPAPPLLVGTTNGTGRSDRRGGAVLAEEGDRGEGGGAP